jgi:DNA-directed RNA polymerase, mitochondrial
MNATAPISDAVLSRQLDLEAMSRSMGMNRFLDGIRSKQGSRQESTTPYGRSLLRQSLAPLTKAIEDFLEETKAGKPGRRALAAVHLEGMDPEVLAFITSRTIMDLLATLPAYISPLAQRVGTAVETEARLAYFEEKEPGLFHTIGKTSAHLPEKRRRDIFSAAMGEAVEGWTPWGRAAASHVGLKLLELMEATTGFIRVFRTQGPKGPVVQVAPTDAVLAFVGDVIEKTQYLSPQFLPMVIPPLPWKDSTSGGYVTANIPPQPLVRTRHMGYLRKLDRELDRIEPVISAVNLVQGVAWRVGQRVYIEGKVDLNQLGSYVTSFTECPQYGWAYIPNRARFQVARKGLYGQWHYAYWAT